MPYLSEHPARQAGQTGPNNLTTAQAEPVLADTKTAAAAPPITSPATPAELPAGQVSDGATTSQVNATADPSPAGDPAMAQQPDAAPATSAAATVSHLPIHDRGMAERALTALDFTATKFSFQTFADSGDSPGRTFHCTLDEFWPTVLKLNTPQCGAGAYVTINKTDLKGRKAKNILLPRALFVDADNEEQVRHCASVVQASGCLPSMTVKTGRGLHLYWLADDIPLDQFSKLQKQLADKLGTDGKVIDLPRVLRLPGTLHLKNPAKPKLITLLNKPGTSAPRWQLSDLVSKFGLSLTTSPKAASISNTGLMNPAGFANGPAKAFAGHETDESLSDGIKSVPWFNGLPPELKDEAADYALGIIAKNSQLLEIGVHGGDNDAYYRLTTAVARSGAPHAEDIFVKHASGAKDADPDEKLRHDFERCAADEFDDPRGAEITVGTLIKLATEHGANFDEWKRTSAVTESQALDTAASGAPFEIICEPHDFPDEQTLPMWDFIFGTHLIRGEASGTAAAGGIGKSTKSIAEALAMASGKPLLGANVPRPVRVLIINLEDNRNTMEKRIAAAMRHYGLTRADIGGRLFVIAKGELKLKVGPKVGPATTKKFVNALTCYIKEKEIDVVSIDPFIRVHSEEENNTSAI